MKDLANSLFTVTVDELRESLSYNGEATFFYHGMESSYNNPWHPEKINKKKRLFRLDRFGSLIREIIYKCFLKLLSKH